MFSVVVYGGKNESVVEYCGLTVWGMVLSPSHTTTLLLLHYVTMVW
jgi:hypothetical protein